MDKPQVTNIPDVTNMFLLGGIAVLLICAGVIAVILLW